MKQKKPKSDVEKIKTIDSAYVDAFYHAMHIATPPKVIRQARDLNMVEVEGNKIYRQKKIYIGDGKIPEQDIGWVTCAPTDNHFVYRYAGRIGWTLFCTCGSPAVVVTPDAYKELGSANGQMLVCMSMLNTNPHRHQDGGM